MTRYLYRNFLIVLAVDTLLVAFAWYFANLLRFNFDIPPDSLAVMARLVPLMWGVKIITFYFFDLYRGMWRYTSLEDLLNILKASTVSTLVVLAVLAFTHGFEGFPRAAFVIDLILTVGLIAGYRIGIRLFFWLGFKDRMSSLDLIGLLRNRHGEKKGGKKLLILGAGDCGEKIYREIRENASLRYNVVGFLDDDRSKVGRLIHGVPVLGSTEEIKAIAQRMKAEEALIAIPSLTSGQMRAMVEHCKQSGLAFKTVPGMGELINGKITVKAIRDVAYKDLIGREVIELQEERIGAYLEKARVLVTGAGGSIGSELCRQICRFQPASLILYERSESPLYEIDLELKTDHPELNIIPILGDIRDRSQISKAFAGTRPQVVFHAAAYKHVPMMEMHPWKAVKNNILGTRNVVEFCHAYDVERFVLVSTDKAVRSVNVMGATKRVAEMVVQGQNNCSVSKTKFMTVRFGNVVGSVGSVVPIFKKQIERGGPVTVTHPEMTRYFMTIPEACQLILQAGAMGEGGEIFILEMGTPVKIVDMARDLIRLSGFEPDQDIKIEFVGLRPGEKLFEELITEGEGIVPTSHERIMVLRGRPCDLSHLNGLIDEIAALAYQQDSAAIKSKLQEMVEDYRPGA
jgi:FlaA1/EpsC-like NDP-sugar epimerase